MPYIGAQITAEFGITQAAVSQHLKVLLEAGLVSSTAEGTRRVYALVGGSFFKLNIWLDQFWQE